MPIAHQHVGGSLIAGRRDSQRGSDCGFDAHSCPAEELNDSVAQDAVPARDEARSLAGHGMNASGVRQHAAIGAGVGVVAQKDSEDPAQRGTALSRRHQLD